MVDTSVCLSLCLSRAGLCQKDREIFTDGYLCFWLFKVHLEIQKGSSRARALNESELWKKWDFWPLSRCNLSEWVLDRTKFATDH